MTHEEKARELVEKFYVSKISTNSFRKEESKQCALIDIQNTIDALTGVSDTINGWCNDSDWLYSGMVDERIEELEAVREAITKL